MGLVSILEPEVRVEVRSGALRCVRGRVVLRTLRPHAIDALHLHGSATLTSEARYLLLKQGTDVVFLTRDGRFIGRLSGAMRPGGDRRLRQYAALSNPRTRLAIAQGIVRGKLANQRALLMRRRLGASDPSVKALEQLHIDATHASGLDVLRGIEGMGARRYFDGFSRLVRSESIRFEGRNRRPPRDPINAMLSYAYVLLSTRIEHAVRTCALDPYLGALHEAGRGAPALALDLMEEWRPLADSMVLTLVNRGQVTTADFRTPLPSEVGLSEDDDVDAVYLQRTGTTVLVRAWERAIRDRYAHPDTGDRWTALDLFREQAMAMARCFGEAEPQYAAVELWS